MIYIAIFAEAWRSDMLAPSQHWLIVTDPPNDLMTQMWFENEHSARETLAAWRANGRGQYSHIVAPSDTYKIVRGYFRGGRRVIRRVIRRGLTLEEAQTHCADLETSSRTCRKAAGRRRTAMRGHWFDVYTEE